MEEQRYTPLAIPCPKCGECKLSFKLSEVTPSEEGPDLHTICEGCGWDGTVRMSSYNALGNEYDTRNRDAFIERVEAWKEAGRL